MFLNNMKTPLISPLYYDNRFMADFKEKAELFNSFLYKQCSIISNNSSLPSYSNYISVEDIGKIIQNLDSNKAHRHDNINICLLKIRGYSVYKALEVILDKLFLLVCLRLNGKKETLFLFITLEIYKSFDDGLKVRGVLLDILKAFDKVWHKRLSFKLK